MPSTAKKKRQRKMSFEKFLTHLRALREDFLVTTGCTIRRTGGVCPVSAVCNALKGTFYYSDVVRPAADMGMSTRMAWRIANASDTRRGLPPVERNYRNRMLRALKLREVV